MKFILLSSLLFSSISIGFSQLKEDAKYLDDLLIIQNLDEIANIYGEENVETIYSTEGQRLRVISGRNCILIL